MRVNITFQCVPSVRLFPFAGEGWTLLEGLKEGQTQLNFHHYEHKAVWCHPIDIHLTTLGIQCKCRLTFMKQ